MGGKKIVDPMFWDNKLVSEQMTSEEKFFYLFLITNPDLRQLGIYNLPISKAAYYLGFKPSKVKEYLDKFQNEYHLLRYNEDTNEIAIRNYLRHGVLKGGKPLKDCLSVDANNVKDKELLIYIKEEYCNSSGKPNDVVDNFIKYDMDTFLDEEQSDEEQTEDGDY